MVSKESKLFVYFLLIFTIVFFITANFQFFDEGIEEDVEQNIIDFSKSDNFEFYNYDSNDVFKFVNTSSEIIRFKIKSLHDDDRSVNIYHNGRKVDEFNLSEKIRAYITDAIKVDETDTISFGERFNTHDGLNFEEIKILKNIEQNIFLGEGWYPNENWYHSKPLEYMDFNWMSNRSTLKFYNDKNETIERNIGLKVSAYRKPRNLNLEFNNKSYNRTVEFTLDEGRYEIFLENISFEPGENELEFYTDKSCDVPSKIEDLNDDDRCLSIALYEIYFIDNLENAGDFLQTESTNKNYLNMRYYFSLSIIVLFVISLIYFLISYDMSMNKKILLLVFLLFFYSFFIRYRNTSTYELYLDEPWSVDVAENIYNDNKPAICSYQNNEKVCDQYYKPLGYPVYLSLLFTIFGFGLNIVFLNNIVLGSMTIPLIFLLVYKVTKKLRVSILSSLLFSVLPIHIFWSNTAESYITSFFFVILSLLLIEIYREESNDSLLYLSLFSALMTVIIRIENILFLLLCLLYVLEINDYKLFKLKYIVPGIILVIFISVYGFIFLNTYNIYFEFLELKVDSLTSLSNSLLFLYPLILISVFLLVSKFIKKRFNRLLILLLMFFAPINLIYTGTDRFIIPVLFVFLSVISYSLIYLLDKIDRYKISRVLLILVAVVIIISPLVMDINRDNLEAKELQTNISDMNHDYLNDDCYLITEAPSILTGLSNKMIDTEYVLDNGLNQDDCYIYYEGIGCELGIESGGWSRRCDEFKMSYELQEIKSHDSNNLSYTFYNVKSEN